jgi:hypothetical protein
VNRLGFGAMRLARPGIPGGLQDEAEARRVLRRAVQLGVGFIDTAHAYGASERLITEALHPYPDGLIVATKGGLGGSGPDGRPEAIRRHCERSLTVLRREVIDLYQLHTVDPCVRIEESLGAIVDLQRGKGSDDRRLECERRRARAGAHGSRHRLGPESLQRWRPTLRRRHGALPAGRDRLSSMVFRSGRAGSRERRNMRGWQIRTARPRHRWRSRGSFSARR